MLWVSLRANPDVAWGVSQYFAVALQQYAAFRQVADGLLGGAVSESRILDFACGHGRLLRFLARTVSSENLWACDIQRDALDFVVGEFGVHGFHSTPDPAQLSPGQKFDLIWVASLFSHLPDNLFVAWLRTLLSLLTPRGFLCFSVPGEAALPPSLPIPETGFRFHSESENAQLDRSIYGTMYVSDAFVRRAIGVAGQGSISLHRITRGLAEQDIYVVSPATADLSTLKSFRRGVRGCLDKIDLSAAGDLRLQGWAASLDDGPLSDVEIVLDGVRHQAAIEVRRGDVAEVLQDDRLALAGFDYRQRIMSQNPPFLEVTARSARDEAALIYAGPIAG